MKQKKYEIPLLNSDMLSTIVHIKAYARVPLYFKSYAMSGPEKITSRGL